MSDSCPLGNKMMIKDCFEAPLPYPEVIFLVKWADQPCYRGCFSVVLQYVLGHWQSLCTSPVLFGLQWSRETIPKTDILSRLFNGDAVWGHDAHLYFMRWPIIQTFLAFGVHCFLILFGLKSNDGGDMSLAEHEVDQDTKPPAQNT